jgi:hypothetical protein
MAIEPPVKSINLSPTSYVTLNASQTARNSNAGNYQVFSTLRKTSNGKISYTNTSNGACTQTGLVAYVTDIPGAIKLGDTWTVGGEDYEVKWVEPVPVIDKTKGKYVSTGVLDFGISTGGISGGATGSVKAYNFDISINTFTG